MTSPLPTVQTSRRDAASQEVAPVDAAAGLPRLRLLVSGGDDAAAAAAAIDGLKQWALQAGVTHEFAQDLPRAARRLADGRWDLVLAILGERPEDELDWWVDAVRDLDGGPRLVALVQRPSMRFALHAEQLGVSDLLSLPLRRDDFLAVLQRHCASREESSVALPAVDAPDSGHATLVGRHRTMLNVYTLMARVAKSDATVLIQGESGTGKEVVARAIHEHGERAAGPFVAVNCAAIPENLLESELFGHEKGAFTGSVGRRAGRFELAVGGTLFLDEVADMSLTLQAKILRAVQERKIERVGGEDVIPVDVRLVAATHRNLHEAISRGAFREDLYYRLAIVTIHLPRLADRGDDLLLLASHFLQEFAPRYGKRIAAISDHALRVMRAHQWVGNVRELRNVIEHAVIVARSGTLRFDDLPDELRGSQQNGDDTPLPGRPQGAISTLAAVEVRHIAKALAQTGGAVAATAMILGIHRNTLTRKMKEYGL